MRERIFDSCNIAKLYDNESVIIRAYVNFASSFNVESLHRR